MPRKVLISFLGTGRVESEANGNERQLRRYQPAKYKLGDDVYSDSFVAAVLVEHYDIDKVFLIGSVHSMWEEIYNRFYEKSKGRSILDDDNAYRKYDELLKHCKQANKDSELSIPYRNDIEDCMGGGSKIVLVRYGLNETEIRENQAIVLALQSCIDDGDELIVDITHSFRSLPIYLMNLLVFLQNIKGVRISHIHYGMLEGRETEKAPAPIVDLRSMMDVQEWITGVYNFKEFGNAYKLAELLRKDTSADYEKSAKALELFSDIKNLNYLRGFKTEAMNRIKKLTLPQYLPQIGQQIIPDVVKRFMDKFPQEEMEPFVFQFRMAEWHRKHHNYGYALINLAEAITTFCCKIVPSNMLREETDNKNRELVRKALYWTDKDQEDVKVKALHKELEHQIVFRRIPSVTFAEFSEQFCTIMRDRNMIGHDLDKNKKYTDLLDDLEKGYKFFKDIIGSTKYI